MEHPNYTREYAINKWQVLVCPQAAIDLLSLGIITLATRANYEGGCADETAHLDNILGIQDVLLISSASIILTVTDIYTEFFSIKRGIPMLLLTRPCVR